MKKVLVIAYYFPPVGGSGVQRPVKFVKYLRRLGWEPVVLTRWDKRQGYFAQDETMLAELPDDLPIIRLESPEILTDRLLQILSYVNLQQLGRMILGVFLMPDHQILWVAAVLLRIRSILRTHDIKLIYTSAPPQSLNVLGMAIKKLFGVPWVADYPDPWTHNAFYNPKLWCRHKLNLALESASHRTADAIVANTHGNRAKLIRDFGVPPNKVKVLTNGYDEEDFPDLGGMGFENERFNIVYAGAFYPGYVPDDFLNALAELCESDAQFRNDVCFHLAAIMTPSMEDAVLAQIRNARLDKNTIYYGYLPYRECVALMMKADLLLLLLWSGKGSDSCGPSKLYQYLRVGKPVLAIVPKASECAALLNVHNAGIVVEPGKAIEVREALSEAYCRWRSKRLSLDSGEAVRNGIGKYSWQSLAGELSDILDASLSGAGT